MKMFKLSGEMVIVETYRQIDRVNDRMMVVLTKDIEYQTQYYHEKAMRKKTFQINITKESNPELWVELKDASNDEFMEYLLNVFKLELDRKKKKDEIRSNRLKEQIANPENARDIEHFSVEEERKLKVTLHSDVLQVSIGMSLFNAMEEDFISMV